MRFGIKITHGLRMEEESLAAEGVHASAAAELPTSSTTSKTAALSAAEGSSSGLPAGFTAQPEVHPLRSGEVVPPLRQQMIVKNQPMLDLPPPPPLPSLCSLPDRSQSLRMAAGGREWHCSVTCVDLRRFVPLVPTL